MTPNEERLVLELHSKWGNRWSRIARKLPGRTDNEIKNYWRTHMRKQAQERKKGGSAAAAASATPSSSTTSTSTTTASSGTTTSTSSSNFSKCFSSVSIGNSPPTVESVPLAEKDDDRSFYDTGGINKAATVAAAVPMASPVDEIWKDMDFFGDDPIKPVYTDYGYGGTGAVASSMASPAWDYFQVPLWTMDEEVEDISKKFPPISDQFFPMNSALATW